MANSLEDMNRLGREFLDSGLTSLAAMSKGLQAMAAEATEYSRRSAESGSHALEQLFASPTLDKVIEVQSDYARSAYRSFVSEATRMNELLADTARDVVKPFEAAISKRR